MIERNALHPRELFLQVGITSRCNLSCAHCYVDDAPRDVDPDLVAECVRQFSDLRDRLGIERAWVQLSGGEPLSHRQLDTILKLSAARFPTKVLTNGTQIDQASARLLANECESVQVSFDGDRETHDRRRGDGSFDTALAGLKTLREAGVPTSARITVGSDNVHCVEPLFHLLEPMIDAYHVSRVVPIGGCEVVPPDPRVYRRLIYSLYSLRTDHPKIGLRDPFFGVLMSTHRNGTSFRGCSAGISGLCVTETGDIYPCRRLPIPLGNIQQATLADVYLDHPLLRKLRKRDLSGGCGTCEHRTYCGGSRCVAFGATGDPLAEDPGCIFA